jgi:Uncharacterized protein conserved in bacteria (DUF2062)
MPTWASAAFSDRRGRYVFAPEIARVLAKGTERDLAENGPEPGLALSCAPDGADEGKPACDSPWFRGWRLRVFHAVCRASFHSGRADRLCAPFQHPALLGREAKGEVVLDLPAIPENAVNAGMMDFAERLFQRIEPVFLPMLIGGTLLGLACAAACYFIVRLSVERFKQRRKQVRVRAAPPQQKVTP